MSMSYSYTKPYNKDVIRVSDSLNITEVLRVHITILRPRANVGSQPVSATKF